MAATTLSPEIAIRAATEVKDVVDPTPLQKRISTVRALVQEDPHAAVGEMSAPQPLVKERLDTFLDKSFIGKVAKDEKRSGEVVHVLDDDQRLRKADAERYASLANNLLKNGYDALPNDEKESLRGFVQTAIRGLQLPNGDTVFTSLNEADIKQMIETHLHNPKLLREIQGALSALIDAGPGINTEKIQSAQRKIEEAAALQMGVSKQKEAVEKELGLAQGDLDKYTKAGRQEHDTIQENQKSAAEDKIIYNNFVQDIQEKVATAAKLRQTLGAKGSPTTAEQVQAAEDAVTELRGKMNESTPAKRYGALLQLTQDKATLEAAVKQYTAASENLEVEFRKAETATLLAKGEYDLAVKPERNAIEADISGKLKGLVTEAAVAYFSKRLERAKTGAGVEEEKLKAENASLPDRVMHHVLKRYGYKTERGKERDDTERIDGDYEVLVRYGPEALMQRLLTRPYAEIEGETPTAKLTAEQANEQMKDKDWVGKTQGEVVEKVLTRRVETGSINEKDAEVLLHMPWGQAALAKAFENNETGKAVREQLVADGKIRQGSVQEAMKWLGEHKGLSAAAIILLIILLFGAAVMAGGLGVPGVAGAKAVLGLAGSHGSGVSAAQNAGNAVHGAALMGPPLPPGGIEQAVVGGQSNGIQRVTQEAVGRVGDFFSGAGTFVHAGADKLGALSPQQKAGVAVGLAVAPKALKVSGQAAVKVLKP